MLDAVYNIIEWLVCYSEQLHDHPQPKCYKFIRLFRLWFTFKSWRLNSWSPRWSPVRLFPVVADPSTVEQWRVPFPLAKRVAELVFPLLFLRRSRSSSLNAYFPDLCLEGQNLSSQYYTQAQMVFVLNSREFQIILLKFFMQIQFNLLLVNEALMETIDNCWPHTRAFKYNVSVLRLTLSVKG